MGKDTKAVLHSKDRKYTENFIAKLKTIGIEGTLDNFLGNYIIYVATEDYLKALAYGRANADEKCMGFINHYDEFRGLHEQSLVYAELKDHKDVDKSWEYGKKKPNYLNALMLDISRIVKDPYIRVNISDASIEIMINSNDTSKHDEVVEAIKHLIEYKYCKFFKRCYASEDYGKILVPPVEKKEFPYQNLYHKTMFMDGMFYPMGSNIAPKGDYENDIEESGYWISTHSFGGQDFNLNPTEDGRLQGSIELYEKMEFNSKWDAVNNKSIRINRTESTLVDKVTFSANIECLSADECVITTDFVIKRKADVFPRLPFNQKYPTKKSVRNGIFIYPLENGEYIGTYTERFVKIANGTRLLHFSDQSPFFEVFEIPEDFSFEDFKAEEFPKVFDDTTFDKDDKDMSEIMKYLGKDAKKLVLENK